MLNINVINQIGKAHIIDGKKCEDAYFISKKPLVCCLADGVSNSKYGGIGAKVLVDYLGKYLTKEKNIDYLNHLSTDEIRLELFNIILQITNHLCEKYKSINGNDFASTLMICFGNQNTITIVHAGDGAIFAESNTKVITSPLILSYPDDNERGQVYHASHKETKRRMRVLRINRNDLNSIILGTDGFTNIYLNSEYQGYDSDSLMEVFKCNTDKELYNLINNVHLSEKNVTDDISAILIRFNDINYDVQYFDTNDKLGETNVRSQKVTGVKPVKLNKRYEPQKSKQKKNLKHIYVLILTIFLLASFSFNIYQMVKNQEILNQIQKQEELQEKINQKIDDINQDIRDINKKIEYNDKKSDEN